MLISFPEAQSAASAKDVEARKPTAHGIDPELVKNAASQGAGRADPAGIELSPPNGGSPNRQMLKTELGRMSAAVDRSADRTDQPSAGGDESAMPSASGRVLFSNSGDVGIGLLLDLVKIQQQNRKTDAVLLSTDLQVQRQANTDEAQTFVEQGKNALANAFTSSVTDVALGVGGASMRIKGINQEKRSLENNAGRAAELREMNARMEKAGAEGGLDAEGAQQLSKRAAERDLQAQELERNHKSELLAANKKDALGSAIQNLGPAGSKMIDGAFNMQSSGIQYNRKILENTAATMQSAVSKDLENLQGLSRQVDEIMSRAADVASAHGAAVSAIIDRI
ncbi:hypothetical protein WJ69_34275 [Burkholderia ubonensis]|nr:hypothetical protein WJ69_34275 [Burkholderia ubonensis]